MRHHPWLPEVGDTVFIKLAYGPPLESFYGVVDSVDEDDYKVFNIRFMDTERVCDRYRFPGLVGCHGLHGYHVDALRPLSPLELLALQAEEADDVA